MQLSAALHRRPPPPGFANHTPRAWEITAVNPSQSLPYSADMFGLASEPADATSFGAGPLDSNAASVMGQTSSSTTTTTDYPEDTRPTQARRDKIRKASSTTILRHASIRQTFKSSSRCTSSPFTERTLPLSRPDSWSMHYDRTNQAPTFNNSNNNNFCTAGDDRMMTQTSLARLPKDNPSHDLAFFLRTTGPTAPHHRPSKIEHPRRTVSGKNALKLFRGHGEKRKTSQVQTAHERLNGVLRDEGGLLPCISGQSVPKNCQQKVSSTGKRYLALVPENAHDEDTNMQDGEEPSILSNGILESRVSVCCFDEDITSATGDVLDNWLSVLNHDSELRRPSLDERKKPASTFQDVASRLAAHQYPTPVRPAASEPPSPIPESVISMDSYRADTYDRPPPKLSFDATRALTSHPISPIQESRSQTPKISLPREEFPVKHPNPDKEVEIKHPLPRRLGSHPVLLQRASSIASTMYPRSVAECRDFSDSPGPPPPKSPLRLRRDPRTIDGMMTHHESVRRHTPKIAPSIRSANDLNFDPEPIRATVTTTCSGPLSRPKSSGKSSPKGKSVLPKVPYPTTRREREERVRSRKLRATPAVARTFDSVTNEQDRGPPQRLKKMRPRIQIPAPLRTTSVASRTSDVSRSPSWKKVTQSTLSPVSPVPSLASVRSQEEQTTRHTPISPTASAEARYMQTGVEMSPMPMMMVAEKVPVPKTAKSPKPPKLILKDNKSKVYKPRPRSASLPRNAIRKSRQGNSDHSSPRTKSPSAGDVPPLSSAAPTRALPPTPPQSGPERPTQNTGAKRIQSRELSTVPSHDVSPISTTSPKHYPHIITQLKPSSDRKPSGERKSSNDRNPTIKPTSTNRVSARMNARLEALEKQNALLQAALMAVLKTNGELNNVRLPSGFELGEEGGRGTTMAWETRVARRSAAATRGSGHAASSINGSALDMYMSARGGC